MFCSCKNTNDDDQTTPLTKGADLTLEGTKWKLAGIVDKKTDYLKVLEPKDCEECYTLAFDTDSAFSSFSASNELTGDYKVDYETNRIQITNFGGTKMGEIGDGNLWWNIIPSVESFSLKKDELKLYYDNENYYLLFKPQKS